MAAIGVLVSVGVMGVHGGGGGGGEVGWQPSSQGLETDADKTR